MSFLVLRPLPASPAFFSGLHPTIFLLIRCDSPKRKDAHELLNRATRGRAATRYCVRMQSGAYGLAVLCQWIGAHVW